MAPGHNTAQLPAFGLIVLTIQWTFHEISYVFTIRRLDELIEDQLPPESPLHESLFPPPAQSIVSSTSPSSTFRHFGHTRTVACNRAMIQNK